MTVPFLDLHSSYVELKEELDAAYRRVMASGWYILGPEVESFETAFADYCGVKHCIGVGNGLEALLLILRAYGIGAGAEVIVPSNTYIATWLAVSYAGATIIPVEPDEDTYNIDPELLERAISPKTKALIAVHLYGKPADIDPIIDICRARGVRVIEDAAQAHGANYKGRGVGSLADAAGFSFYPTKNLGAFGDAGAVTTDDDELADRVRLLRNYGSRVKYENEIKGYNSRLDPLQAALLNVRLKSLGEWNKRREFIADRYLVELADLQFLKLPRKCSSTRDAWHQFVVRHSKRDQFQAYLRSNGVETLIHYPIPPHRSSAYSSEIKEGFPIAEAISETVISLPMGPHLTADQQSFVIDCLRKCPTF